MSEHEEFEAAARQTLDRILDMCTQLGLKYLEIPSQILGIGAGVGFAEEDFVVLSVPEDGDSNELMITSGVLNDIKKDRISALEACNSFTCGNSLFPVYLHAADAGWALLMQQTNLVPLLLKNPDYFAFMVRTVPQVAAERRAEATERWEVGGRPWKWDRDELGILLIRSLT